MRITLALLLLSFSASASNITGYFMDQLQRPWTNPAPVLKMVSPRTYSIGGTNVMGSVDGPVELSSGNLLLTNLVQGYYTLGYGPYILKFMVPDDTNTYNILQLATNIVASPFTNYPYPGITFTNMYVGFENIKANWFTTNLDTGVHVSFNSNWITVTATGSTSNECTGGEITGIYIWEPANNFYHKSTPNQGWIFTVGNDWYIDSALGAYILSAPSLDGPWTNKAGQLGWCSVPYPVPEGLSVVQSAPTLQWDWDMVAANGFVGDGSRLTNLTGIIADSSDLVKHSIRGRSRVPIMGYSFWATYRFSLTETNVWGVISMIKTNGLDRYGWKYLLLDDIERSFEGVPLGTYAGGLISKTFNPGVADCATSGGLWYSNGIPLSTNFPAGFDALYERCKTNGLELGWYFDARHGVDYYRTNQAINWMREKPIKFVHIDFDYESPYNVYRAMTLMLKTNWPSPPRILAAVNWTDLADYKDDVFLMADYWNLLPGNLDPVPTVTNIYTFYKAHVQARTRVEPGSYPFVEGSTAAGDGTNYMQVFALNCMLSSPLLIQSFDTGHDPLWNPGYVTSYGVCTNSELIAIDQDELVDPPTELNDTNGVWTMSKRLSDGGFAVCVWNYGTNNQVAVFDFNNIGIAYSPVVVRDILFRTNWGNYTVSFTTPTVVPGDLRIYKFSPVVATSGDAQTPLLSDIDAAGFSITNLNSFQATGAVTMATLNVTDVNATNFNMYGTMYLDTNHNSTINSSQETNVVVTASQGKITLSSGIGQVEVSGVLSGNGSGLTAVTAAAVTGVLSNSVQNAVSNAMGTLVVPGLLTGTTGMFSGKLVLGGATPSAYVLELGSGAIGCGAIVGLGGIRAGAAQVINWNGRASMWSDSTTSWTVGTSGSVPMFTVANSTATASNGYALPQLNWIPTNSIPSSSSAVTNWVLLNLTNTINGGGPMFCATNIGAAGSFLLSKPTLTQSTWP